MKTLTAEERIRLILEEYEDDITKEACDNCERCSKLVMCDFHSLLSLVEGRTLPTGALR